MLTIRREQMGAFRAYMSERFVDEMLGIVHEYFPEDCRVLGQEQARKVIRLGIERAGRHGFETRGDVCCDYVCLIFALGSYFDEDPLLPWVAEALENQGDMEPSTRMSRLYEEAAEYSERVDGPGGAYHTQALLRARRVQFPDLAVRRSVNDMGHLKSRLQALYPERCQALREAGVRGLIHRARSAAGTYGLPTPQGLLLYAGIVLILGSHFDRDPLHPWAGAVLEDMSVTDPITKARRLHEAAMARLDQAFDQSAQAEE